MTGIDTSRRAVLTGLASLAGAGALAGSAWLAPDRRRLALGHVSRLNDKAQGALFSSGRMAQTYPSSDVTIPFPFNGMYPQSLAPTVDAAAWRLAVEGRVTRPLSLNLPDLRGLDAEEQITRLICIEGWSAVGRWSGPPLSAILRRAGADLSARHVALHCADGYWTSIDMASALHPQTILALDFLGSPLPVPFGFPARLRIPTKLGFKNAKHVDRIVVTDDWIGGYWEDQGYNWFAGL